MELIISITIPIFNYHHKEQLKKLFLVLTILISFLNFGCCVSQVPVNNQQKLKPNVHQMLKNTAALVEKTPTGKLFSYCASVFISQTEMVSAFHCIQDEEEPSKNIIGHIVKFQSYDQRGTQNFHNALVWGYDEKSDLLMLHTLSNFPHSYVEVAKEDPEIGDNLYVVGHPLQVSWNYTVGILSSIIEKNNKRLLFATVPGVYFGNSGGGIYSSNGKLISISDAIIKSIAGSLIGVDNSTLNNFIKENRSF